MRLLLKSQSPFRFRPLVVVAVLSALLAYSSARAADPPAIPADALAALSTRNPELIEATTFDMAFQLGGAMPLLPAGWIMHPVPGQTNHVQPLIDSILLDIFKTPTGSRFCAFMRSKAEIIHYIGLSPQAADSLPRACTRRLGNEAGPNPSRLPTEKLKVMPTPRRWIIVVVDAKTTHLDSYTNVSNLSPIVLTRNEINRAEIIYRVIHELAVGFDAKSTMDINWYTTYAEGEVSLSGNLPNSCTFLANANQLHMTFAGVAGRSLTVETKILQEFPEHVGYTVPLQQIHRDMLDDSISCEDKATAFAYATERFRSILPEYDLLGVTRMTMSLCPNEAVFMDALQRLSATRVRIGNGVEQNGCEMMMEPQLGRWNTRATHGPRPNLGCGVRCSEDGGGGSRTRGGDGD